MSHQLGVEVWPELMGGSCWGHFITRNHPVKLFDDRGVGSDRERSGLGRNRGRWGSTARGGQAALWVGEGATSTQVRLVG